MLKAGQRIQDRYEVEALVGQGGLAEVYRVRHVDLGSVHALKLLLYRKKSLSDRLLLEGRIQAQLRHPNVVAVTDVVRHEGQYGLLMEYVDNVSLDEMITARGSIPVEEALTCIAPVMAGVNAAHQAGVLHRDLKPANVLLAKIAGGVVPKVADFGIAKVVSEDMDGSTRQGVAMGTPGYMAPEQVLDARSVDVRTDVFALAAILYELISGRRAFADDTGEVSVKSTLEGTFIPLDELVEAVPPHVADAVSRALSRDREDRPGDVISWATSLFSKHPDLLLQVTGPGTNSPLSLDPSEPSPFSLSGTTGSGATRAAAGRGPTIAPMPTSMTYDGGAIAESASLPPPTTAAGQSSRALLAVRMVAGTLVAVALLIGLLVLGQSQGWWSRGGANVGVANLDPGLTAGSVSIRNVPASEAGARSEDETDAASGGAGETSLQPSPRNDSRPPRAADQADRPVASSTPDSDTSEGTGAAESPDADPAADTDGAGVAEGEGGPDLDPDGGTPDDPELGTAAASAVSSQDPDAAGTTEDDPPPEPEVAVVIPEAMPVATFLETAWQGRVFRQPFTMRISRERAGEVWAEGRIVLGSSQRTVPLVGRFDPRDGALFLRQTNGDMVIQGVVTDRTIIGSYWREGKDKREVLSLSRR